MSDPYQFYEINYLVFVYLVNKYLFQNIIRFQFTEIIMICVIDTQIE